MSRESDEKRAIRAAKTKVAEDQIAAAAEKNKTELDSLVESGQAFVTENAAHSKILQLARVPLKDVKHIRRSKLYKAGQNFVDQCTFLITPADAAELINEEIDYIEKAEAAAAAPVAKAKKAPVKKKPAAKKKK